MTTLDRISYSLDSVQSTSVSDIVLDPISGKYVRIVQFFTDAIDLSNRRPVIELRLVGDTIDKVQFATPKLVF